MAVFANVTCKRFASSPNTPRSRKYALFAEVIAWKFSIEPALDANSMFFTNISVYSLTDIPDFNAATFNSYMLPSDPMPILASLKN